MTDITTIEDRKTIERYNKQQERVAKLEGEGSTDGGLAIVNRFLVELAATLPVHIEYAREARGVLFGLVPHLLQLKPELLALCVLQTTLHTIGRNSLFGGTVRHLGQCLEGECFSAGLTKHSKRLATDINLKMRAARGSTAGKRAMARQEAVKRGFKLPVWDIAGVVAAGGWMLDWLLNSLPSVFVVTGEGDNKAVRLTESALEIAQAATNHCAMQRRVYMPRERAPPMWTDYKCVEPLGPYAADRYTVVRLRPEFSSKPIKDAIKDGSMQPCLDGLNALQAVPWRVNTRVLDVQRSCIEGGIKVEGLPGLPLESPHLDKPFDELTPDERTLYLRRKAQVRNYNQASIGDWISLEEDWAAAALFPERPFWTPMSMDWRGRVYAVCQFNFQREDRVRSLFLFDQGEPLGKDGLRWLMIHAANCWANPVSAADKRKTDKIPLEEREQWAKDNLDKIIAFAQSPMTELFWTNADAPWCFLAACFEIAAAVKYGPEYSCALPVSFDGSCSGVQHLAAMTRAASEGSLVNLTPSSQPADVYYTVAAAATLTVQRDAARSDWSEEEAWKGEVARLALGYGIDRKVAKRNTMTWAYSSKRYGMGGQQQEDLMEELAHKVLLGELSEHPFGEYARGSKLIPGKAARYLGSVMYNAIEEVMCLPGKAMHFLQDIAKILADEQKSVTWASPSGLPCTNAYTEMVTEQLVLFLHVRGVRVCNKVLTAVGHNPKVIRRDKAANSIAPNFVHSHDAAHVHLVARAAPFALATVHDSFGCLPSRAAHLNTIIREQFVQMYEQHDVLAEVLERSKLALTVADWSRLPPVPSYGTLDLRQVLNAEYAFA